MKPLSLAGAEWFSTLDLASGYWQVPVADCDRAKTAFATRKGLFQWKVMPFGLANAPATFSRLMEMVLRGLNWERCLVYLDDIIVFGTSFDQALTNLVSVLEQLRKAGLGLKLLKCSLFQSSVKFLGHVVSKEGVACDPDKISCVRDWETPKCVTEVRSFLGFASYYRRFIPNFATIAAPLTKLTEKYSRFSWSEACVEAFDTLKKKLINAPVLAYPQHEGLLILDTDASSVSISGCLSQVQNGEERILAYGSKSLSSAQQKYCTTKRELLAVVQFVQQCTQCKRPMCTGGNTNSKEAKILHIYGDVLDMHDQYDVFEEEVFQRLPLIDETTPEVEKLNLVVATSCAMELDDYSRPNWLGSWTVDQLREWQEEDPAIKQVKTWITSGLVRPKWREISHESGEIKALWSQWSSGNPKWNLVP